MPKLELRDLCRLQNFSGIRMSRSGILLTVADVARIPHYRTVPSTRARSAKLPTKQSTTMRLKTIHFICLFASASAFAPGKLTPTPPTRRGAGTQSILSTFTRTTQVDLNSFSSSSSNAEQSTTKSTSKRKKIIRRVGKIAVAQLQPRRLPSLLPPYLPQSMRPRRPKISLTLPMF